VSRFYETRVVGNRGHVVVTFVDDHLRRRTVAVPYAQSVEPHISELIESICTMPPMIPPGLDDGKAW
jgi:hypothetical protein